MKKECIDKTVLVKFGLVMVFFWAGVVGFFLPWLFEFEYKLWPLIVSVLFLIWVLFRPLTLVVLYNPWMYVGGYLGAINSKIILVGIFIFLFIPIALFFKLINRDALSRKVNKKQYSYWSDCEVPTPKSMENIY